MAQNPKRISICLIFFSLLVNVDKIISKSTIEACPNPDSCPAMVGYTLYDDLKVSEVSNLFQIDTMELLLANSIDISFPDVENQILPSQLFMKIPINCSCVDGIRKSTATRFKVTLPTETLFHIANTIFSGLVSADQLRDSNSLSDSESLDMDQILTVPLPCTCFNNVDNNFPAIYLSYVVRQTETLDKIAKRYATTATNLMNVNSLNDKIINPGDILAIPLPACASNFQKYGSDYGLYVASGSYSITADQCVQCCCGSGSRNLFCMPSPLDVPCSSMQCENSNLMLGNSSAQPTSGGCNVTACNYAGYVNGSISTVLSNSLQSHCPGPRRLPQLIAPPTSVKTDTIFTPVPAPQSHGAIAMIPKAPTMPPTGLLPGLPATNGPVGSPSDACSLVNTFATFPAIFVFCLCTNLMLRISV